MRKVGDRVVCRLYNTPEGKFYGESWNGKIVSVDKNSSKPYVVTRPSFPDIALHRKEVKSIKI